MYKIYKIKPDINFSTREPYFILCDVDDNTTHIMEDGVLVKLDDNQKMFYKECKRNIFNYIEECNIRHIVKYTIELIRIFEDEQSAFDFILFCFLEQKL